MSYFHTKSILKFLLTLPPSYTLFTRGPLNVIVFDYKFLVAPFMKSTCLIRLQGPFPFLSLVLANKIIIIDTSPYIISNLWPVHLHTFGPLSLVVDLSYTNPGLGTSTVVLSFRLTSYDTFLFLFLRVLNEDWFFTIDIKILTKPGVTYFYGYILELFLLSLIQIPSLFKFLRRRQFN